MRFARCLAALLYFVVIISRADSFIGVGVSQVDHNIADFNHATGSEIYLGHRWLPWVGVSTNFTQFGIAQYNDLRDEGQALGASINFYVPLGDRWEAYGFAGIQRWRIQLSSKDYGMLDKDKGEDGYFGAGLHYSLTPHWRLGMRYSTYLTEVESSLNTESEEDQAINLLTGYLELHLD